MSKVTCDSTDGGTHIVYVLVSGGTVFEEIERNEIYAILFDSLWTFGGPELYFDSIEVMRKVDRLFTTRACSITPGKSWRVIFRCGYAFASWIETLPIPPPTSHTVVPEGIFAHGTSFDIHEHARLNAICYIDKMHGN